MKRVWMGSLAVVLAIGGCPSQELPDPEPGVVSILAAGSYSGTLSCRTVDKDGVETNQKTVTGKVLVTEEGGLRLYNDNIAPGDTLSQSQLGITIEETINSIDEEGDTLTMQTTGSITYQDEQILTARTVTLQQADPQTIDMTDQTVNTSETTDQTSTNTCTGSVTQ